MPDPSLKWDGDRYYAVVIANRGRTSLRWSEPYATAADAKSRVRAELDAGTATMGFVVLNTADEKWLCRITLPPSASKIVGHYLELMRALEDRR